MRGSRTVLAICLGAAGLRLAVLPWIRHPGIADPNHYYNLGLRLMEGHGFTIDYIWQYRLPPAALVHPIDHWMPFAGLLASASMALFGPDVRSALLPFVALGAALPALAYIAARRLETTERGALFCALVTAALPELVLNSVRTDTTIVHAFLVCATILLFMRGLAGGDALPFAASGAALGLDYLTRHDATLIAPALLVAFLVHSRWAPRAAGPGRRWAILTPVVALLVVSPWLVRNLVVLGTATTSELGQMLFYANPGDNFAYGRRSTLETMLASRTPGDLLGRRLFELAGAAKLMYTTLDVFLPVAVAVESSCF